MTQTGPGLCDDTLAGQLPTAVQIVLTHSAKVICLAESEIKLYCEALTYANIM